MKNSSFDTLVIQSGKMEDCYQPIFFDLHIDSRKHAFEKLFEDQCVLYIKDDITEQLRELMKCLYPHLGDKGAIDDAVNAHLGDADRFSYGLWVYYPWNGKLVHLLGEEEFFEVRTNRNRNKITREEQWLLKDKKIGIVGLSVGQSIALTLAMERTCGELRLADFDTAELSNLNRIRTGVHNLGVKKTVIAAREILEIDPYLTIKLYHEGLRDENIDDFFMNGGPLDLFVEVCDGLDIKIKSRFKAKSLGIPVVMDTNDRGMLDVERFDLEPERGIFHGFLDHLMADGLLSVSDNNRMQILKAILSFDDLSERMKLSMAQIGKTISTWPQLASSVVLGGAITTDIARKILLGQHAKSGRYYVDLDALFL